MMRIIMILRMSSNITQGCTFEGWQITDGHFWQQSDLLMSNVVRVMEYDDDGDDGEEEEEDNDDDKEDKDDDSYWIKSSW